MYLPIIWLLLIFPNLQVQGQGNFVIENGKSNFKLKYQLFDGLVLIPVEINGLKLSFLLDTGVDPTVLFSVSESDSLDLYNTKSIYLRGLGDGGPIKAIKAVGNTIKIGDAVNKKSTLYVVTDSKMSLSNRLGIPINGIIGYDFFKDFIVEINYSQSYLNAYTPGAYNKKCRRCSDFDLVLQNHKPYIKAKASINEKEAIPLQLLVDSGSGDAVWLFTNKENKIEVPEAFFNDFLGFGMGGSVYGKRSRIKKLQLKEINLKNITASFPDSIYFKGVDTYKKRNGSLGSLVLKRFLTVVDYPHARLRLKPNRYFKDPFEYDMSGVVVAHSGFGLVQDYENPSSSKKTAGDYTGTGELLYQSNYQVKFSLQPQFQIVELRPDSPAEMAGLAVGDILISVNGRDAYRFSLNNINKLLSSAEGKKIRMKIMREGHQKDISFRLKRIL